MTPSDRSGAVQTLQFEVPSALEEIAGATRRVFDFFSDAGLSESDRFDLRLSFEEILINAMKHGNGYRKELPVRVTLSMADDGELKIAVQDQGKGFDVSRVKDPTIGDNIEAYSGRGVYLVKHLMDRMEYLAGGTRVEISKRLKK